jgi:hypothetical protein
MSQIEDHLQLTMAHYRQWGYGYSSLKLNIVISVSICSTVGQLVSHKLKSACTGLNLWLLTMAHYRQWGYGYSSLKLNIVISVSICGTVGQLVSNSQRVLVQG